MSIAAMSGRWLRRKLRQVGEGTLGRHGIHRPTVAWLILIPSFRSSPWMRGANFRYTQGFESLRADHSPPNCLVPAPDKHGQIVINPDARCDAPPNVSYF